MVLFRVVYLAVVTEMLCILTSINRLLYMLRGFARLNQDADLKRECDLETETQKRQPEYYAFSIF